MASFVPDTMPTEQTYTSDKSKATQLNKEIKELTLKIVATEKRISQISKKTKDAERDQRRLDRGSVKRGAEDGMDVDRVDDGSDDLILTLNKLTKDLDEKKRSKKAMIVKANKKKKQAKVDASAARKLLAAAQFKAAATAKKAADDDEDFISLMGSLTISQEAKKARAARVDLAAAKKNLIKAERDIFSMNSLLAALEDGEGGAVKRRSSTKRMIKRKHKTGKKQPRRDRKNRTAKKSNKTRKHSNIQ